MMKRFNKMLDSCETDKDGRLFLESVSCASFQEGSACQRLCHVLR